MEFKLAGKTALVCGGSSGIGLAIAQALAKHEGINILLVSSNNEKLQSALERLPDSAVVGSYQADLSSEQDIDALLESLTDDGVCVDILINNSGGPRAGDIFNVDRTDWLQALQNNFLSHLTITRHCLDHMCRSNWGRVINITTTLAVEPSPQMIISASVRACISAFSKALSDTVCAKGVSVNTICPGGVRTDRLIELVQEQANSVGNSLEETLTKNAAGIPIGRFAEPEELASLAEYLCSEEAGYITGRVHAFDGSLMKSF